MHCSVCKQKLSGKQAKYCSNICQHEQQYSDYITAWKQGKVTGRRGLKTINISKYLKRYLFEKYNHQCAICSWQKKHPVTNQIPLEINHLDGDATNNRESNLELICPNCHALTVNFRNLNKGRGCSDR